MQYIKLHQKVASFHRHGALRIASAYHSVSKPAIMGVSGIVLIDLLTLETKRIYEGGGEVSRNEARNRTMQARQDRWRGDHNGKFTYAQIGYPREWGSK